MFHILRRYEPLCSKKPKANILRVASTQKIARKTSSVASWNYYTEQNVLIQQNTKPNNKIRFIRCKTCVTLGWFTKVLASTVLSPLGRCSSRANTTQLAMMVNSTAYSNGVQYNWIKKKYSYKYEDGRKKLHYHRKWILFLLPWTLAYGSNINSGGSIAWP